MCTLHSFPHNIDHCLTWARSEFDGLFQKTPSEVNKFLSDPKAAMEMVRDAMAMEQLEHVIECLDKEICSRFEDSIAWAWLEFEDYFCNRVKQLTYTFPENVVTSIGSLFWNAPKSFLKAVKFSSSDPTHLQFFLYASMLRAEAFGIIHIPEWANKPKKLAGVLDNVVVLDFEPQKDAKIDTDEKATSMPSSSINDTAVISQLVAKLEECGKLLPRGWKMNPIQFEKVDNTNHHMDLISRLANMRARNYSIPEVDRLKAKFIAGRINPAIATTTAMATGLVCLELYKVLASNHPDENFCITFANLALPMLLRLAKGGNADTEGRKEEEEALKETRKWLIDGLEGRVEI